MTAQPTTDAIWTHLSSDLLRFISRRVPDDHVADDLLQETFVRVHSNIGTLQEADRLAAWVYQIARNVINDHHRNPPLLIPACEVARLLGISKRTLWRLLSAGKLPAPVRLGNSVRWRLDQVEQWISRGCPAAPAD